MKSIRKNLCHIVIICCTISIKTVTSESFEVKQNHPDDDLKNLGVDIFFGTNNGNISVHYNSTIKPGFNSDVFKLNSSNAVTAMAKGKNHLVVAKEDGSIYACPFDFNTTSYRCTDKPRKLDIDAVQGLSMAVVGSVVYFVGEDGSEGHCELNKGACYKSPTGNKYTGIAANGTLTEFYISLHSGELFHCLMSKQIGKHCEKVFEHTGGLFYQGLSAVHVANNTVWIGTENGQLLKCLWTRNKERLECHEFLEIEWEWLSFPMISSISSKNGQLFARIEGRKFNKILRCDMNDSEKCTTFQLLDSSRSFLIV